MNKDRDKKRKIVVKRMKSEKEEDKGRHIREARKDDNRGELMKGRRLEERQKTKKINMDGDKKGKMVK